MASRALTPLRATCRRIRLAHTPSGAACQVQTSSLSLSKRTIITAAKPSTTTTTTATTTTAKPVVASSSRVAAAATPTSSASESGITRVTSVGRRVRVPAVSGQPLPDAPPTPTPAAGEGEGGGGGGGDLVDWTQSYHGLGTSSFGPDVAAALQARLDPEDIEVKPDGIIYLPEIKYRRILNAVFGPGGWGLAPRGNLTVHDRLVTREYALVVQGRFVAQARGEMQYFNDDGVSTAAEGAKSNALMRCCKDLGIASELWDPRFIRKFMKEHAMQQWVENVTTKKKKQIWLRKDDEVRYPFKKS